MRRTFLLVALAFSTGTSCNFFFPFNADQACESEVRALCHFTYSCCNAAERGAFANGFGVAGFRNEGECVNELLENGTAACGNSLEVQDAINQGRFEYDGALAEKCLKPGIDALSSCDASQVFRPDDLGDECSGAGFSAGNFAFGTGKVKEGKGCFEAFECADAGSACELNKDDNANDNKDLLTAAGTCKSPGKEGDDCTADTGTDGLCEPGTFCDGDTCQKIVLKQNGEGCFLDGECGSDFCNDINGLGGAVCADKLQVGDDCLDDNDCDTANCFDDGTGATCQEPAELVVDGCNGIQGDDTKF